MYACYHNNIEMAQLLITAGACLNVTDDQHRMCLHYAAMNDNSKLIEAIVIGFKN